MGLIQTESVSVHFRILDGIYAFGLYSLTSNLSPLIQRLSLSMNDITIHFRTPGKLLLGR